MSFAMNPEQVKRREYFGLGSLIIGLINVLAGIVSLLFLMPLGLALMGFGAAVTATGIFILTRIPDMVGAADDLW